MGETVDLSVTILLNTGILFTWNTAMDSALTKISEFIQAIPPLELLPSHIIEQIVKESE